QMPLIKDLLRYMGIAVVEKEGYEADDVLGTLSAALPEGHCYIATGDRDSLQLVDGRTTVLLAATKMGRPETVAYDEAAIAEKYGLTPSQLIDLKALMGDASDHIPGVPGVGEKTALELMHRFGSLDAVYAGLEESDLRDSLKAKLRQGKDSAYLSQKLGTICRQAPVSLDMNDYALRPMDREPLAALMTRLELFKLMEKWGLDQTVMPAPATESVPALTRREDSPAALLESAKQAGICDLLPVWEGDEWRGWWIGAQDRFAAVSTADPSYDAVTALWANESVAKRTHDGKPLYRRLLERDIFPKNVVMDTMLAGYLLNPLSGEYGFSRLAAEYGAAADESGFAALCDRLSDELKAQNQWDLLQTMEIPLSIVLADMERVGFLADRAGIAAFGETLGKQIDGLQASIYEAVGYAFNLNSPKQLAKALFEDLGLPAGKKTKSGYSTNAEVLEGLRHAHPAVSMLLDYRTLSKLKSTYCDGLLPKIDDSGRIHSSFNQTETRTGRISSAEPNLQNIPVRQELGREMRRFFIAQPGWVLCDADYSQIELRVLAHMAQDPTMIRAFNTGEDIHTITASQVFGVPVEMVTPLMRSRAKAVNFGIIYGIGPHSLSQDIGVTYGEAKRYIDDYLRHYSAVDGYMKGLIDTAKQAGYSVTLFHRRRPLPELRASNAVTRGFGERVARNMPIQGTAADIIKLAMVRVYDRLRREGMRARLILQIHDELIVEAPREEADRAARILQEEMEGAVSLSVKLAVDAHIGDTWYDAKG
ncbi:MAG: DNA polymerase I, partial [Acutalibacteraceae bacterium]